LSLILEALKKLDREKQAPDRGLLVVGPASWPSRRGGRATAATSALVGGVLAVVGMGAVLWLYGKRSPPAAATSPAPAAVPAPAPVMAPPTSDRPAVATGRAPAMAPTPAATPARASAPLSAELPPVKAAKASPAADRFQLQAISARDGHPVAVLNDRLVREGDTFDGVRVVRIGADEVEIEVAGRRRLVKF
jgi:hypothetical protein